MFTIKSQPDRKAGRHIRQSLIKNEALPVLTLMGLLVGVLAGGSLIVFTTLIDIISRYGISFSAENNFSALSPVIRFILPVVGAVCIIVLLKMTPVRERSLGVPHVIEQLIFHHGELSIRGIIAQFWGALLALVFGFSVGREGPAVHIGAGIGSQLGQSLNQSDNFNRVLIGCGVAAAISAAFNTPLAGMVFAIEVVLRKFSMGSFIPVMAASVVAAVLSRLVYGADPAFFIPTIPTPPAISLERSAITLLMACMTGVLAGFMMQLNVWVTRRRGQRIVFPMLVAGLLMGSVGYFIPDVMGLGYRTITSLLEGQFFSSDYLVLLLVVKLTITALVLGLGVPGGIIGPLLFIGATIGALSTVIISGQAGEYSAPQAMVGMVAMMAAVLQAPFAALITVLEMTNNPHIILSAMESIIIACLIVSQCYKFDGLFFMQLKNRGIYPSLREECALSKVKVAGIMNTHFCRCPDLITVPELRQLQLEYQYAIIRQFPDNGRLLVNLEGISVLPFQQTITLSHQTATTRIEMTALGISLQQALTTMKKYGVNGLYIVEKMPVTQEEPVICGVITRQMIYYWYASIDGL